MVSQKPPTGLHNLRIFITADALLAVIMSWAQLWIQPYNQMWGTWYAKQDTGAVPDLLLKLKITLGIGLTWTYGAIFLALLALLWIVVMHIRNKLEETPDISLGLFIAALIMSILEVGQSAFNSALKTFLPSATFPAITTGVHLWLAILLFIVAIFIIVTSIWGVKWIKEEIQTVKVIICKKYVPWILCGFFITVGVIASIIELAIIIAKNP
jgi:hypothetical protein